MWVKYLDYSDARFILLRNYGGDWHKDDVLKIKYNPEYPEEIVYPQYIDYCVYVKRRNIIIAFIVLIVVTLSLFILKRHKDKMSNEYEPGYWF